MSDYPWNDVGVSLYLYDSALFTISLSFAIS